MPNVCHNNITITAGEEMLKRMYLQEFKSIPASNIIIHRHCKTGILFSLTTAWTPDYEMLERIVRKYPSCWIKNAWRDEGGFAGVWIGTMKDEVEIKRLEWEDMSFEEENVLFSDENLVT